MLVRPFKHPLSPRRYLAGGRPSTLRSRIITHPRPITTDAVDVASLVTNETPKRANGVFFISNVLPIRLGRFEWVFQARVVSSEKYLADLVRPGCG
jgi:hypothetical protein